MAIYVALLRGINVGGKNMIKMPTVKECFEADGFEDVVTYIQSGNVLFRGTGSGAALATRIEKMFTKGFGADPTNYLYDLVFVKEPLTASAALNKVPTKENVDEVHAGRGVLYFSRLKSRATSSRLNRVASLPIYQNMTIRNWNTTTSLLRIMDEASGR